MILLTGSTGQIGSHLAPQMATSGVNVRAMVRHPSRSPALEDLGIDVVRGDFEDRSSVEAALRDVDTALLLTPPHPLAADWAGQFLRVAQTLGLRRLVRISALKASASGPTENTRLHARTEDAIREAPFSYCILRPHFLMQNTLAALSMVRSEGVLRWGMGGGKVGIVDARDIADVAATVLMEERFDGGTYELTGPALIDLHAVARALGDVVGREVRYVATPPAEIERNLLQSGVDPWLAHLAREYSAAYASGWGAFVTNDVAKITGHRPRSIRDFALEVVGPMVQE